MATTARLRQWAILHVPDWLHPAMRSAERGRNAVAGKALRLLPGTSRQIGPPRHIAQTLREYTLARPNRATYREIYPSHWLKRSMPRRMEAELDPAFAQDL